MLYLIVTQNGRVVQTISIPSAGRLDDDQSHHVFIRRQNRQVHNVAYIIIIIIVKKRSYYRGLYSVKSEDCKDSVQNTDAKTLGESL